MQWLLPLHRQRVAEVEGVDEATYHEESGLSRYVQQGLHIYANAGWAARLFQGDHAHG